MSTSVSPGPRWWHWAVAVAVTLFVAFEVYGPALDGPFVFDDRYLPFMAPEVARWTFRQWLGVRPLLMTSFWLNYRISGLDPSSYHTLNLLLHVAGSFLMFAVLRKLLDFEKVERRPRDLLAGFGAALFLLHPVQTESVAYVASRSEALSVALFLGSYCLFLYRREQRISFRRSLAVLALFGAAVLTKEHAVMLPFLLLLTDYYWNPGFSFAGIRRNWKLYCLSALGALGALKLVLGVLASATTAGFALKDLPWYQYFFTQCRVIWQYFFLFALPFSLNVDPDVAISRTLSDHGAIFGLIALAALLAAAFCFRKRWPLASFGVLAALLLLAPTSSVAPLRDPLAEHRVYLPFVGFVLIVIEFLRRWKISRSALAVTLGLLLMAAGLAAWSRNHVWSSAIALWQDSVSKSPQKARPRFQLAYAYFVNGQFNDAIREYGIVATLDKPDDRLLVDWALAFDAAGRRPEALDKLKQAAAMNPTGHVWAEIGRVYLEMGSGAEAAAALDRAETLDSGFDMTYVYRGDLRAAAGDLRGAAEQYRRALGINAANQPARERLSAVEQRNGLPR